MRATTAHGEIATRLASVHGTGRVAETLYAVTCDLLMPDVDALPEDEWTRLNTLVQEPVRRAAAVALEVLAGELEDALGGCPSSLPTGSPACAVTRPSVGSSAG